MLVPPGAQLVGLLGFVEAFDAANRLLVSAGRDPLYDVQVVGVADETPCIAGPVLRTQPASEVTAVHTLVVGGALDLADHPVDPAVLAEAGRLAGLAERVVSVCMGAFVLGSLGWLDGRRCTCHWLGLDALRARFPLARVEDDAIFTEDGGVCTSAGATAGIDLALQLIRRDRGSRLALAVARALVVFAQRPGGQSQFGSAVRLRPSADDRLSRLVNEVVHQPGGSHTVEAMARRVGMSARHFARVFAEQTGETPAAFVARARVEAAQRALAQTDASLAEIADQCGFGTPETLRRTFLRVSGATPSAWRDRFQAHPDEGSGV
ncbi:MAG: helix-turn-helix domain-containing protein [Myxococcota bacterium]